MMIHNAVKLFNTFAVIASAPSFADQFPFIFIGILMSVNLYRKSKKQYHLSSLGLSKEDFNKQAKYAFGSAIAQLSAAIIFLILTFLCMLYNYFYIFDGSSGGLAFAAILIFNIIVLVPSIIMTFTIINKSQPSLN